MDQNLGLRKAVGIILARDDGKIWTGKRKIGIGVRPNEKNLWQMPQGGIDFGESPEHAAYRELEEETGTKQAEIVFTLDEWLEYSLPPELIGKALGGKFKGQKQKWFIVKFLGNDSEININTKKPEFFEWKWIDVGQLTDVVVHFKLEVYKKLQHEIKNVFNIS